MTLPHLLFENKPHLLSEVDGFIFLVFGFGVLQVGFLCLKRCRPFHEPEDETDQRVATVFLEADTYVDSPTYENIVTKH